METVALNHFPIFFWSFISIMYLLEVVQCSDTMGSSMQSTICSPCIATLPLVEMCFIKTDSNNSLEFMSLLGSAMSVSMSICLSCDGLATDCLKSVHPFTQWIRTTTTDQNKAVKYKGVYKKFSIGEFLCSSQSLNVSLNCLAYRNPFAELQTEPASMLGDLSFWKNIIVLKTLFLSASLYRVFWHLRLTCEHYFYEPPLWPINRVCCGSGHLRLTVLFQTFPRSCHWD